MTDYTVRFDRGTRAWTCSVFRVGADGKTQGAAVASGTGTTRGNAREMALSLADDPDVRAALASADHTRPYWVQGTQGEQREAQRKAAAHQRPPTTRAARTPSR